MMIPAVKTVFLLSLFTLLETHARTLPEDIFKISNTDYRVTSSFGSIRRPPKKSPPPPQVKPPTHPIMTVSYVTKLKDGKIIRMPRCIGKIHNPPPPAPYVAPPHDQARAYHGWTSIFATRGKTPKPIHLSQQVASAHHKLWSFSYVTGNSEDDEIIKRPELLSPPPPHVAPPHVQMEVYATE